MVKMTLYTGFFFLSVLPREQTPHLYTIPLCI